MLKHITSILLFTIVFVLFGSFSLKNETIISNKDKVLPPFKNASKGWVDSVMSSLSLEEKIGQLFMVAAYSNLDKGHVTKIEKLVEESHVGGIIFFQGSPVKQAELCNKYQSLSEIPLLIGQDCEWGLGMRLDSVTDYPYQMMLGAIQDDKLIYEMGVEIGESLNRIGVHTGFAPVIDINNNPNNPVINHRSFGSNKNNVARKGLAYMKGLQDKNIIAIGKHFPGHGDTEADSHKQLPIINQSSNRIYEVELFPFRQLINGGLSGIMTAHLAVRSFDSTLTPASLSYPIVSNILKRKMGFDGLIFTDALNMKGARNDSLINGKVELKALKAGNDVLLMSKDIPVAISVIKKAVEKGKINIERIEYSCRKIIEAKHWVGLNSYKPIDLSNLTSDLNKPQVTLLHHKLAEAAVTMVKNENELIPLKQLDTLRIASINIGNGKSSIFQEYLSNYVGIKSFKIKKKATKAEFNKLKSQLDNYNLIIVGITNTSQKPSSNFGITNNSIGFIKTLSKNKSVILSLFANAYSLSLFNEEENIKSILVLYDDKELNLKVAAQSVFGGIPTLGHLPVYISDKYTEGTGVVNFKKIRLKYAVPEAVGFDSQKLNKIDSIVESAIEHEATPGCQVLVAKDGAVIYNKAFGHFTYSKKHKVRKTDLYDLASLTKISATLPSIMRLSNQGKFCVDSIFSTYIDNIDTTNKADIVIKNVLCHQAKLQAWIPFYISTIEDGVLDSSLYRNNSVQGFSTQVAKDLYLLDSYKDSIFNYIYTSELREKEEYKYSDLGYYLLKEIIEKQTKMPIQDYTYKSFYSTLGATSLGYLPLKRYDVSVIAPTEDDKVFRKQVIRGHVHDPGAAMLGGVSGHAGLFSNANDLAKLMQMYLQGGEYGDVQYIDKETIEYFSTAPFIENENRRGIGFDKPALNHGDNGPTWKDISPKSYGHTGFTGTIAWIDPETQLIYIFLSNRTYPDAENWKLVKMNVRTDIQEAIYDALK